MYSRNSIACNTKCSRLSTFHPAFAARPWWHPAMNVGTTPQSVEVYCFAPGIDPNTIDVNIEKGVLTIAGERKTDVPAKDDKINLHIDERFAGKFRRVVTLPEDADPDAVQASYRDGVLQVSVQRRKAVQPRRITIQ
jgi:HSP20 family protein